MFSYDTIPDRIETVLPAVFGVPVPVQDFHQLAVRGADRIAGRGLEPPRRGPAIPADQE
jgi:hypothetical protein